MAWCTRSSACKFNRGKQSTLQIVEAFFPGELDSPDGSLQLHSNYVIAKLLQNHRTHSSAFLRTTAAAQCSEMIAAFEWMASLKAEHKGTYNGIPSQAQRCSCLTKPSLLLPICAANSFLCPPYMCVECVLLCLCWQVPKEAEKSAEVLPWTMHRVII